MNYRAAAIIQLIAVFLGIVSIVLSARAMAHIDRLKKKMDRVESEYARIVTELTVPIERDNYYNIPPWEKVDPEVSVKEVVQTMASDLGYFYYNGKKAGIKRKQ